MRTRRLGGRRPLAGAGGAALAANEPCDCSWTACGWGAGAAVVAAAEATGGEAAWRAAAVTASDVVADICTPGRAACGSSAAASISVGRDIRCFTARVAEV